MPTPVALPLLLCMRTSCGLLCHPPAASKLKLLLAREPFSDFGIALKRALAKGAERTVVLTMQ